MSERKTISPGLLEKFKSLQRRQMGLYAIISADPIILHTLRFVSEISEFISSFKVLFEYLKNRRVYMLYSWGGYVETDRLSASIKQVEQEHKKQYPNFAYFHLCNTPRQLQFFQAHGLKAILCNHNCMVDENIFKPLPFYTKKYDAVYDARLMDWKRHYLAAKIESLALIYYSVLGGDDLNFAESVRKQLAHAHFFNHTEDGKYQRLNIKQVNKSLNKCCVGLCLSDVEGAMYASGQYLLSGMPVVTTPSLGGRDEFFDKNYVATVEANPDAVRAGVEKMLKLNVSAEEIRVKTIEKMRSHRQRFISLVQSIYDSENCQRNFASEWNEIFFDKLLKYNNHAKTIEVLQK